MVENDVAQLATKTFKHRRIPAEQARIIRTREIERRSQQNGAAIGVIGDLALVDHFLRGAGGHTQRHGVHVKTGSGEIGHRGDAFFGADRGAFARRAEHGDTVATMGHCPARMLAERGQINHILAGERGRQGAAQADPACCFFYFRHDIPPMNGLGEWTE